ncbi:MAG TPA: SRPBCC family protein [Streptosporangiaceae bacterium]|jgi:hypothetical protein
MFGSVAAGEAERQAARPGDDLIARPDVVMDRAFTVAAPPAMVWPWLVQLGKQRAGWYLPAAVERFLPPGRRAAHGIRPAWQQLGPGDVIPDYGGRDETFQVAAIEPESALVYRSTRGRMNVTWSITLRPVAAGTRVHLRLRLGPVRRKWLARTAGEFIDALTIAAMAAGLRERLADQVSGGHPPGRPADYDS